MGIAENFDNYKKFLEYLESISKKEKEKILKESKSRNKGRLLFKTKDFERNERFSIKNDMLYWHKFTYSKNEEEMAFNRAFNDLSIFDDLIIAYYRKDYNIYFIYYISYKKWKHPIYKNWFDLK